MIDFLKSLRRGPEDHREIFAEFALALIFLRAEHIAGKRSGARLRVVG